MSRNRAFYIPDSFRHTWEKFLQIANREGKKASPLLRQMIAQYVAIHDPGNPQARITSYSEGGPVDIAVLEGRVREHFRFRASQGKPVSWREIVPLCREAIQDVSSALAMAQRVDEWLRSQRVRVWK